VSDFFKIVRPSVRPSGMKVRELIELLKSAPQEAIVFMENGSLVERFYPNDNGGIVLDMQGYWDGF